MMTFKEWWATKCCSHRFLSASPQAAAAQAWEEAASLSAEEQMKRDCAAACELCDYSGRLRPSHIWRDCSVHTGGRECKADPIRRAWAEQQKGGGS